MRILGLDPGLRITGYGCVEGLGEGPTLVEAGVFRLGRENGSRTIASVSQRLLELSDDLDALLERTRPELVVVEGLFAHYRHPATAITMGHARGVILLAIRRAGLSLMELKPGEIKKSLTGHGQASKQQMQATVQRVFDLPEPPNPPDVADALAIALCAARRLALGVLEVPGR